ncbi:MAG: DsbA family oxidoreductase [Hyphomonadaceae bacterium]
MPAATVDFFADLSCPWCYVGWEALKRAAEARPSLSLSLTWRTFFLHPDMPAEGVDRAAYLSQRFPDKARLTAIHDALSAAALAAGATLNASAPARIPNTMNAHRMIHWAASRNKAEAAIDALFQAYWVEGRDIGDAEVLCAAAHELGFDETEIRSTMAGEADIALVRDQHAAAVRMGVSGVPIAIINRETLVMGAESPEKYGRVLDAAVRS